MKTIIAMELVYKVGHLIQLCATFQAKYGRYYVVKPGSSTEAWALYHDILNQQLVIAQMLDVKALEAPNTGVNKWWERQESLDLSNANQLMSAVSQLIATCAYFEAETKETDWSYAVFCAESTIAGLLHPTAIQVALSTYTAESERYVG